MPNDTLLADTVPGDYGTAFDSSPLWEPGPSLPVNRGVGGTVASSLKRGVDQLQATGFGLAAVIADTFGADEFAKSFLRGYTRNMAEAADNPAEVGTFRNIEDAGTLGTYITEAVFENLPNMAASMAGGGVGALAAKGAVARAVGERMVGADVAKRFLASKAGQAAAAKASVTGATIGSFAANVGQETGSIAGDIYERTGELKPVQSFLGGVAAGAVETIGDTKLIKQVFGEAAAGQVTKNLARRLGEAGAVQFLKEGGTEAIQTVIEETAAWHAENQPDKPFWTPQMVDSIVDAALKGGFAGAAFGVGGQVWEEARRKEQVKDLRDAADKNRQLGNIRTAAVLDQQADEIELEPMTLEELKGEQSTTTPRVRGEAAMETRSPAALGLKREPEVSPDLADAIAAVRGKYNPEIDAPAPEPAPTVEQEPPTSPTPSAPTTATRGPTGAPAPVADVPRAGESISREDFESKSKKDVDFPLYGITPKQAASALEILGFRRKSGSSARAALEQLQEQMQGNLQPWRDAIYQARYGQAPLSPPPAATPPAPAEAAPAPVAVPPQVPKPAIQPAVATPSTELVEDEVVDAKLPDLEEAPVVAGGGAAAYAKALAWMNAESKSRRPVGRAASALANARKIRLDPEIEEDLIGLLRKAGVEDVPLAFEGKRFDDWWDAFNKAADEVGVLLSDSNPTSENPITFQVDASNWYKKSPTGKVGVVNFGTTVPSRVHEALFTVDSRGKFAPSETGKRVGIKQGGNLGSVSLAYDWTPENEALMRQIVFSSSPPPSAQADLGAGAAPTQPKAAAGTKAPAAGQEKPDAIQQQMTTLATWLKARDPEMFTEKGAMVSAGKVVTAATTGTYGDILNPDNKNSRALFELITGVKLPKSATATKALFTGKPFPISFLNLTQPKESQKQAKKEDGGDSATPASVNTPLDLPALLAALKAKRDAQGRISDARLDDQIRQVEKAIAGSNEAKPSSPAAAQPKPSAPAPSTTNLTLSEQARLEELKKSLRGKLGQLGAGIDPEIGVIAAEMATLYAKDGIRRFKDYAARMKSELPEIWSALKSYLRGAWNTAADNNPDLGFDDVTREQAVQQLAEVDSVAAVAEPTTEAQNETRPDIRKGDEGGKPTPVSGGNATAPAPDGGNRDNVGVGVPGAGEGTGSGGDKVGNGQRAGRPGVDAGAQDAGGILGGTPAGGTGADTAQPGDGGGVSEPAHNDVGRENYHLSNPEAIVGGGPKARFAKNQEALETYHTLLSEQRSPTKAELDKLAGYTGWGSFGQELFNGSWEMPRPKPGWEIEDARLRDQLGEDGWKSAQQSIINAHYTDPVTVSAMWDMVRRMGFTGGRVLEPSVGIGNFFSLMPRDLMAASTLTGIELDQFTGRMAQMLHPQANIQIKGYQDSKTADNFYDLVIGNWPFADVKPADRRYNHLNANLHDYFFIKALDQVRPGGIVIGITSAGTMDKKNPAIRRYLASRAELVDAFRLPAGTFGKYAGTSVTTDIIILKKRETPLPDPKDNWIESKEKETPAGKFSYNEFYWDNPKNIIGTIGFGRGTTSGRPGMIVTPPPNHEQAIRNLGERVPANVFQPWSKAKADVVTIANTDSGARQLSIVEKGGELYQVQGEQLVVADNLKSWKKKSIKENQQRLQEARDAIAIRSALDTLMAAYRSGADTEAPRQRLKQAYSSFVAKHGPVRDSFMLRYMEKLQDSSAISVLNLEDDNGRPREVLERDVLRRKASGVQAGNIDDAFAVQRNNSLHFSMEEVAKLAKTTPEAVKNRLVELGQIFQTPTGEWQARDEYLSGNVRRKLREAEAAQEQGEDMARNIEALKAVMPKDTPHFEIEVRMGANWISVPDYKDFIASLIPADQSRISVERMATGWNVKINDDNARASNEATVVWGSRRRDATINDILTNAMNGTQMRIYDPDDDGNPVFNQKVTEEVNGKIEAVREQFQKWIWEDGGRTARLAAEYNEVANSLVTPQRDGSYLRLEGLALKVGSSEFDFRKHQRDAVARFTQDGKGMAAHEVGTGKTFTMAGLVMEGRRLGVFRKPIVFAHNANSASVRSDFQAAYPSGKFLYLDSLTPQERQARLRQIALDDWDAIIVPHSLINRFTLSETTMMDLARDEIQALEDEIASVMAEIGAAYTKADLDDPKSMNKALAYKPGAHTAKKLVKQRLRIIERIQKKAQEASKEDAVLFEDLGVDAVLVDEAHEFKKISLATRKQIKGLSKDQSGAGFALSLLTDYVKKQNGGKGVFLFTGTPVTNTLNEVYNMMRYVMSNDMTEAGIQRFDDWFNMFADSESEVEMTDAGTYEAVDRLRAFINVSELARMAGRYFDVVFAKNMPEFKDRTSPDGMTENPVGRPFKKVIPVTVDMSPEQIEHMASIRRRFASWKQASGKVRRQMILEGKDTPLRLSTESSNAALDYRLFDRKAADYKGSKANAAVTRILDIYRDSPDTTQMVFMERGYNDYSEPKVKVRNPDGTVALNADGKPIEIKERREQFNLARDMVEKLMAGGVKPEEIAIFANMKLNPAASNPNDPLRKVNRVTSAVTKEDLAAMMRAGKIRVAFGQTATMGTGVNAQTLLRAMHHLDAPWQPGEFEQRNGRGWRQGNKWNTVLEHRYFAEGSGDGKRWQFLLNKVRFITRFMEALSKTGQENLRTLEGEGADASDANDTVADFEQSFGTAAGDPRQMLKAQLLKKIRKLEIKRDNHSSGVYRAQQTIDEVRSSQRRREQAMAKRDEDSKAFNALAAQPFSIEIEGKTYTDRKEADEALKRVPVQVEQSKIGQWGPFKITSLRDNIFITGPSGFEYQAGATVGSIAANLRNIQHYTDGMRADLKRDLDSIPKLEELARSKFVDADKLRNTEMALKQIEAEIELSPFPAPSWLRNSVPMGAAIYLKQNGQLKSVDVAAHRWDANNWWVLYEDETGQMRPVPYTEVLDETGNPMFEVRKFEKPPSLKAETPGQPTPVQDPSKQIEPAAGSGLLLNVPRQPKPLFAQRDQIRRLLDDMERLERESKEWDAPTIRYSRELHSSLTKRLIAIDSELLGSIAPTTDAAISIIEMLEGKLRNGLYSDPLMLVPIAKLALKLAKALLRAGRTLEVAIREGIAQAKAQMPEDTTDADQLQAALTDAILADAPDAPAPVQSAGESKPSRALEEFTPETMYRTETEQGRNESARQFIDRTHGGDIEAAFGAIASPSTTSGIPDSLRIIIAKEIAVRATKAAMDGNDAAMFDLADKALVIAKQTASETGQALQATNQAIKEMAAEDAVVNFWKANNGLIDRLLSAKFPDVTSSRIKAWLQASGREAVKAVAEQMKRTNNVTDRVLRIVGRDADVDWASLFTSSAANQRQWQRDLFAKIREHPKLRNLSEQEAAELTNLLSEAWQRERMKVFRREFRKNVVLPEVKPSDATRLESAIPELVKQLNLGLLDNEAFRNAVAPRYGQKPVTMADARELFDKAQAAQAKPEGFQRTRAFRDVYDEMRKRSGIKAWEYLQSWWYASVLSGFGTQGRNILGNASILAENLIASVARNPRAAGALVGGMLRGMRENITQGEFKAIMSGDVTARPGMDIKDAANVLELAKDSPDKWKRLLSNGRYVTRFMLAADSFFYDASAEVAAINEIVAQNKTASWPEVEKAIFEKLNQSPEKRAAAEAKAKAEGLTGTDLDRRVVEILEQQRPSEILDAQHRFALEATLNNEPQGLLGMIAKVLITARDKVPPLVAIVPFVRISANVGNLLLQHSPFGLYYVLRNWRTTGNAEWTRQAIGIREDLTPEEYQQLRAKVLLSHAALMGVLAWAMSGADDDDPWFQVTGSMNGIDPDKRRQLEQQGIRPYSLKFGNRSFDYRQTPWATGFAYVGQVMDAKRYDPKWNEQIMAVKFATALAGGKAVILDQNFLSNLMVLLERGPQMAKDQNANKYLAFLGRTAGGSVPTVAKEVDSWFAPEITKPMEAWDYIQREFPIARRYSGTPVVNVLGDPVERPRYPWSWLTSEASDDPVWQALGEKAQRGVFLPVPSAAATVLKDGKRVKMTPEQFAKYQAEVGKLYKAKLTRDLSRFERMTPEQAAEYFRREFEPLREQARLRVR